MKLRLGCYRLGTKRKRGEGLRIGVVRYAPRGVKKEELASSGYYDVWLPTLAPSKALLGEYKKRRGAKLSPGTKEIDKAVIRWFKGAYRKEILKSAETRENIKFIALVAEKTPVSIGCYCEELSLCHTSVLREEIEWASG